MVLGIHIGSCDKKIDKVGDKVGRQSVGRLEGIVDWREGQDAGICRICGNFYWFALLNLMWHAFADR
jgi:hypothetical protein